MDFMRLGNELIAVGLSPDMTDGKPDATGPVLKAVNNCHISDSMTYLGTDLETHAAELKGLIEKEKWDAYVKIQTDLRNELREEDYKKESDGLMAQYLAGEIEKDVWIAKRNEIKQRYPKPS